MSKENATWSKKFSRTTKSDLHSRKIFFMATKKKATKKKVKNGIHLKRAKDGKQFIWNLTKSGRVLADSGEQYHNLHNMQDAMKSTYILLKEYYEGDTKTKLKLFHDETGDVK